MFAEADQTQVRILSTNVTPMEEDSGGTASGVSGSSRSTGGRTPADKAADQDETLQALAAIGLGADRNELTPDQIIGRRRAWKGKALMLQNAEAAAQRSSLQAPPQPMAGSATAAGTSAMVPMEDIFSVADASAEALANGA